MTQRGIAYAEYLRSPEWQVRRKLALEHAENRCQICNADQKLQVHHRTYERVRNELPRDLTVLCDLCHRRFHGVAADGTKTEGKRPRKVPKTGALTVACPTCTSKPGMPCVTPDGEFTKKHSSRKIAARADESPAVLADLGTPKPDPRAADMRAMKLRSARQRKELRAFRETRAKTAAL